MSKQETTSVNEKKPPLEWTIASRGFTTTIATGLLDNLFKVHSFGVGGLLTFIAATHPSSHSYSCCEKFLLVSVFLCLIAGMGVTLWSYKKTYEGQDAFSRKSNSKKGEAEHEEAKRYALFSFLLFILSAILFGICLIFEL